MSLQVTRILLPRRVAVGSVPDRGHFGHAGRVYVSLGCEGDGDQARILAVRAKAYKTTTLKHDRAFLLTEEVDFYETQEGDSIVG